nr:8659_t:CDS:2 [Entrophospora candida]
MIDQNHFLIAWHKNLSPSHAENTTDRSIGDDYDFEFADEFNKNDTCELNFKEIGMSTLEDAIKLHKECANYYKMSAMKNHDPAINKIQELKIKIYN